MVKKDPEPGGALKDWVLKLGLKTVCTVAPSRLVQNPSSGGVTPEVALRQQGFPNGLDGRCICGRVTHRTALHGYST